MFKKDKIIRNVKACIREYCESTNTDFMPSVKNVLVNISIADTMYTNCNLIYEDDSFISFKYNGSGHPIFITVPKDLIDYIALVGNADSEDAVEEQPEPKDNMFH